MKVALVHDWLNGMRGGEKVLEVLCELFPNAPLYTLLCEPGKIEPGILRGRRIHTSWIQRSGFLRSHYRKLLPLMPSAIERFGMEEYDLVISSSHCVAKGVRTRSDACHISYCHTPMRYLWDFQEEYFGSSFLGKRLLLEPLLNGLRGWDVRTSKGVTHFIANSRHVADRIQSVYGRESEIIHPPVDTQFFTPGQNAQGKYFLLVSALVPYKKVDLVLEAFRRISDPLVVVGTGPLEALLRRKAAANVQFVGWVGQGSLREYYRGCRAVLFPQREDFGIVPLEAQACGKPVIAFAQGGALETVVGGWWQAENSTGVFFSEQTPESLAEAIQKFQQAEGAFHPDRIRQNALAFDKSVCRERLGNFILSKIPEVEQSILHYA